MNVQPSKHLVLINGYTHQGQWYEGDSYLSFSNPYALAECWRHYFSNQILDVTQNLWKDYHFMGSTERISVFGPRPYANAISHIRIVDYCNPNSFLTPGKTPEFEPLLYCGFCNQHTMYIYIYNDMLKFMKPAPIRLLGTKIIDTQPHVFV